MSGAHPTTDTLERYASGVLPRAEGEGLGLHLKECAECRATVAARAAEWAGDTLSPEWTALAPSSPGAATAPAGSHVVVGTLVGRYVVIGHLGEGAMGLVLAAWDPRLERKVALKLLRPELPVVGNAVLKTRLLREAKALAKVTHPNVVHVHDVGDFGDSVFIAMDFVEGTTLTRWSASGPHPWREVVRLFLAAGRGLAAAHHAGLVHRDFKPDNVLVGRDGVVRVTDFGVARRAKREVEEATSSEDSLSGRSSLIGTPAYMSPEQLDGQTADARSDQFSFCAALFEALYGVRPIAGHTLDELRASAKAGTLAPVPPARRVPRPLHAVLLRGLSTRPEDRFPSVDALLAQLERRVERGAARTVIAAALALSVVAASVLGAREVVRQRADPCARTGPRVAEVWSPLRKPAVQQALAATGLEYAGQTWTSVERQLDGWALAWPARYQRACAETHTGKPETTAAALARQACLENQLVQVRSLIEILAQGGAQVAARAADAVEQQVAADSCVAVTTLRVEPEDPVERARVRELRAGLARAVSLWRTGQSTQAEAALPALQSTSKALSLRAEQAYALRLLANIRREQGKLDEAERLAEQAAREAEIARADDEVVLARADRAWIVGIEMGQLDRGRRLLQDAQAALARAGPQPVLAEALLNVEAGLARTDARWSEAEPLQLQLIELRTKLSGADSVVVAQALDNLSSVQGELRRYDEALATNTRAMELMTKAVGRRHPEVAMVLTARAAIYAEQAKNEEALPLVVESLEIMEAAPGEQGGSLQAAEYNLGLLYKRLKRYPEALARMEKAIALAEKTDSGPSALVPEFLGGVAETYLEQNQPARAFEAASRALALKEKALGPDSPALATLISIRGGISEQLGHSADAARDLERALALMQGPDASPGLREATRFDLGRALWHDPAQRAKALAMMKAVRKYFFDAGPNYADNVGEVDAWLKEHGSK